MNYVPLPAIFLADAPGLDFLNSVATPADVQVDWLESGEGLLSWLAQAGLVSAPVLDGLRSAAGPGEPRHRRIFRNVPDRVDEPAGRGEQVMQPFIRRRSAGIERHRPEEPAHQRAEFLVDRHSCIVPPA